MTRRLAHALGLALILAPSVVVADDALDPAKAEAQATYKTRRAKLADTAAAHWQLAVWCEQAGLPGEAKEQFAAVVRVDPKREAAWKRLGYKKVGKQWLNDEQIASAAETRKAVKEWGEKLAAIHKDVHVARKREDAMAALAKITDERAIPAIWREFGQGASDQAIAIQVLGQINAPTSSVTLAFLSIYGVSADIRARATETLRGRDPLTYAADLIALLADPMKFEVRPVGGPNSPGILFVEGERFNVRRFYEAPAPEVPIGYGDTMALDQDGTPILIKRGPTFSTAHMGKSPTITTTETSFAYSARDLAYQARNSAIAAQDQLELDIRAIEDANTARTRFNRALICILKDATGKDPGPDRRSWRDWFAALKGYAPERAAPKPTFDLSVPSGYTPVAFGRAMFLQTTVPDN